MSYWILKWLDEHGDKVSSYSQMIGIGLLFSTLILSVLAAMIGALGGNPFEEATPIAIVVGGLFTFLTWLFLNYRQAQENQREPASFSDALVIGSYSLFCALAWGYVYGLGISLIVVLVNRLSGLFLPAIAFLLILAGYFVFEYYKLNYLRTAIIESQKEPRKKRRKS